jgi:hypothetical protein
VLVSLPPSYHDSRAHLAEIPSYEEMCRRVLGFCTGLPAVDVTVSIHPNSTPAAREAIEATGATVSNEWLVSLIPRHDVFLTDFSSTIRWAIAARKPVLNYDIYKFGLRTYAEAPGVLTSERFDDLAGALRQWSADEGAYARAASLQRKSSRDFGRVDGRNFARLVSLLDRLENQAP